MNKQTVFVLSMALMLALSTLHAATQGAINVDTSSEDVVLVCPGVFKLRFEKSAGGNITQYYDLAHDAQANINIAARNGSIYDGLYVILFKQEEPEQWTANFIGDAGSLEVVEAQPDKVKIRAQGDFVPHNGWTPPASYDIRYTVTSSAQIYIYSRVIFNEAYSNHMQFRQALCLSLDYATSDGWVEFSEDQDLTPWYYKNGNNNDYIGARIDATDAKIDPVLTMYRDWDICDYILLIAPPKYNEALIAWVSNRSHSFAAGEVIEKKFLLTMDQFDTTSPAGPAGIAAQYRAGDGGDFAKAPPTAAPQAKTYQQWRASLPADYPTTRDYMRVLSKFVKYCDKKGYWAGGRLSDPMGKDNTKTYALVLALLVGDPGYDSTICGLSKDDLKDRLHTAIGNMGSGYPWKLSYRAAMMLCAADSEMKPGDVKILKQYIYKNRDLKVDGWGKPMVIPWTDGWVQQADMSAEEQSWTLAAKSMFPAFYPNHPEHDARLDLLQHEWVDIISTLDMKDNTTTVGTPAKPLNQWASGVNINADYTFDNHFNIHVGYMYDTIHFIGTIWTVFNEKGHAIPTTFYWNEPNVYNNFLRFLHLWDGRNFYVNGTDWSMYQYSVGSELNYYSGKKFRNNDRVAASIERGLLSHFEWRQKFMAGDLTGFSTYDWPDAQWLFVQCMYDLATSYFHNLANGPWTGGFATEAEINARANGNFRSWVSSRTITNRTDHRLAKAGEERGWAVIPRNGDHMGTWEGISVGGTSSGTFDDDPDGNCIQFDDGFTTTHTSSFTALPDGKSVLIMEQSGSSRQTWKTGNWLFNDEKRTAYHAGGSIVYDRTGKSGAIPSSWFNVDDKISYIDMEGQTDVFSAAEGDISLGSKRTYWPGRYIGYVKFTHQAKGLLLIADVNSAETQNYVTAGNYQLLTTSQSASGATVLIGQDSSWYLVLSNFSSSAQTVSTTLPFAPASYESITGHTLSIVVADVSASLASHTTGVFRLGL